MAEQLRQTLGVFVIEKPKRKTKARKAKAGTRKPVKTESKPDEKKPQKITREPNLVKAKPKPVEPVEALPPPITAEMPGRIA